MTPQERELITELFARLASQAQKNPAKDADASALIADAVARQPDVPYLLVQTVLIQDLALRDAERRIAELQQKSGQTPGGKSFLGRNVPRAAGSGGSNGSGPWSRDAAAPPRRSAPIWNNSPATAPPPAYYDPVSYGYGYGPVGPGSSFLRDAAVTAAGVVGGALLFQGIQSMFMPYYGMGFMGGIPMQPGISETVINNNYYVDNSSTTVGQDSGYSGGPDAGFDPGGGHDPGIVNADYRDDGPGGDFGNDPGFGGDNSMFGGGDGSDGGGGSYDV